MLTATRVSSGYELSESDARTDQRRQQMDRFLAGEERKALAIAKVQLRDREDALDVVQDAMIKLVRRYATRPAEEWAPLFYRILINRIRDVQRRRQVRNRVIAWFGSSEDEADPIDTAVDQAAATPGEIFEAEELHERLSRAVARLPARQKEAFLLRSLEGFDTAATATAMGCSTGSVKTHYSRALHALANILEDESSDD